MKYALVDGIKVEAYKGQKGACPICGLSLISRFGNRKIHHWAHKGIRNCDS
jgi:competence protein CoiA